ncbi:MAG: hypothetical protein GW779_05265 [Candidatus Altiarchaeum hamiconexum]|uniref:Uncharacterized protein n=1 Tax=Candidatus Altarchaeum hamiconexum TaxID=1803513 RepID=A0A8J7YXQ9_9ARCH|nr:hypothetical protein [Candidatus Altarchaeum hamiconexum]OIQ04868.1 MAG: hypothetical protein AUK59_05985 [Candidatus Altarchaeum sp. CG2_30_32_3053]PIN67263.1 MAG: hypothetical protein COV98_03875 [Candidatus Altarchaeum sp. CG12_big_fil_rev_8_21_14_0_65_33_22]PIV27673.1 MAG: hypothetical protein COS36_05000 [Candidatus Altarchaeum sp. CG03_land_8_20_14_0_80_32_618]PIX48762.1 MAG: hypothetical protein COZ53_02935 [Candidatus Altarchaeum sp. CG_4_8_14_3_um_filter_33_2054]PIZ31302.1 MAG: hyp
MSNFQTNAGINFASRYKPSLPVIILCFTPFGITTEMPGLQEISFPARMPLPFQLIISYNSYINTSYSDILKFHKFSNPYIAFKTF